jgi:hypothetical protein
MSNAKKAAGAMPTPVNPNEYHSVRIEKIDNGFLEHRSHSGPKGYQDKTIYHAKKPVVSIGTIPPRTAVNKPKGRPSGRKGR